ncbi:unnamed protein product [Orchesella dallaii]|uniref:Beta-ketoacyl synthase-like N-terminal domain-containing protein n=1 Tax=Orchesella dallaii TaxID=48710 RepID=A0ABP1S9V0_9HEXA
MIGSKSEVWATCALNDEQVAKALVLANSLKRSSTNRSIVVLVSPSVSSHLRNALGEAFHHKFILEEDRNEAGLKPDEFVKLFALTLHGFDKILFLWPSMIVLRNSDELFEIPNGDKQSFVCMENMDTSILLLKPSLDVFRVLTAILRSRNGTGVEKMLKNWIINQTKNPVYIHKKYNRKVNVGQRSGTLLGNEKNIFIANMQRLPKEPSDVSKLILDNQSNMLKSSVLKHWLNVYEEAVKPLLTPTKNPLDSHMILPSCSSLRNQKEPIAIVGMSCRYPSSKNLEEFWNLIFNGEDGEEVTLSDLAAQLGIKEEFKKFFGFLLKIVESRGILRKSGDTTWKLISEAPTMQNVETYLISTKVKKDLVTKFYPILLLEKIGEKLCNILRGSHSALSVLFPDEKMGYPSVGAFYEDYGRKFCVIDSGKPLLHSRLSHWKEHNEEGTVLRILEKVETQSNILESSSNRCWILFNEEKEATLEYIGREVEGCRRKVIRVSEAKAKGFQHDSSNNSVFLRGNVKQDFEEIMEWISSRNLIVEGVVYGWSLNKSRTSQDELLQPYLHLVQTVISLKQKIVPRLICLTRGIVPLGDHVDLTSFHANFYKRDEELVAHYTSSPVLSKWLEGAEDFWVSKKLQKLAPSFAQSLEGTMEVLERDILFAKKQGWFQKMGL